MRFQCPGFSSHSSIPEMFSLFDSGRYHNEWMSRVNNFQDTMIEGAFRSMQHDHFFKVLTDDRTEMKDRFVFSAPLPILGLIAEKLVLRRYMKNLLTHRNDILKRVAESGQWKTLLPE